MTHNPQYVALIAKKRRCRSTAKFREETSKKAATRSRTAVAAMHNVGSANLECKSFFAAQQRLADTVPL
jgi:hypothetical protein